jgi:phosphatidylinositol alpha-1,6-mannosyltransferase
MRTLLLTPELFTGEGGIPRILRLYLKAMCELASQGGDVAFLSLNDKEADSTDLRLYAGNHLAEWEVCNRSKSRFVMAALRMGLRSDRIICGHIGQLPLAWLISKLRPRVSYYLVAHGIEVWRPFTFLERRALKGARRIWCVSDFTRSQLLSHCPMPGANAVLLPNALDPYLRPPEAVPAPRTPSVILAISRLSTADNYKGIGHLIAAMPAIRAEIPDARLRIVGRGDGLPALQRMASNLDLPGCVEFAGFRSDADLHDDFASCRLFALPSEKEGFGLVYLEAMAHGRPCLAARSGGAPEVVTPETGVLVTYGDVAGIASAAAAALRRDWPTGPMLERAQLFSYLRFKERLASLILP